MKHTENKRDVLREKTFQFAIRIVRLYQYLTEHKKEFVLSKQILKSGTNPGAMVREAASAESGSDFLHKMAIARKEVEETLYWLDLLHATDYLNTQEYQSLLNDASEIAKLLTSSIKTKKNNMKLGTGY